MARQTEPPETASSPSGAPPTSRPPSEYTFGLAAPSSAGSSLPAVPDVWPGEAEVVVVAARPEGAERPAGRNPGARYRLRGGRDTGGVGEVLRGGRVRVYEVHGYHVTERTPR